MIVPGSASQDIAAALAAELDESLAPIEYKEFANGEQLVRVPGTAERAIIVASTVSDAAHIELLQLQDAVRQWAEEIITVLPYMGYARQEKAFRKGEPISARAVAKAISSGTNRVITVNPHEEIVCKFFDVPCESVDASSQLAKPLSGLIDPLFLSPDSGAVELAEAARDAYGTGEVDHFEKRRISDTEVEIQPSGASTANRDIVLVDDSIATGSTIATAVKQFEEPNSIYVTCVHPVFVGNARTKIENAGVEVIYATDTIERAVSTVSAAPAIATRL